MTPEQFCYWLQGLLEHRPEGEFLSIRETSSIRDHLATVFTKVTPDIPLSIAEAAEEIERARRDTLRERDVTDAIRFTKRIC